MLRTRTDTVHPKGTVHPKDPVQPPDTVHPKGHTRSMQTIDDLNTWLNQWGSTTTAVSFPKLIVMILLTMAIGQFLAWHYLRFSQVLSNKRKFSRNFVLIATTTLLVITIVGSSVTLSLGLVGALSIIRFRTPIKEPEELGYLFLAIGVGLGMGADRPVVTTLVVALVLGYLTIRHYSGSQRHPMRTVLQVSAPMNSERTGSSELGVLMPVVEKACDKVDLRRVDCHGDEFNASLLVELKDIKSIEGLLDGVQGVLPGAIVSVVERDSLD